ncbi:MAG: nitrogen fixation protein FixH [Alphaproteobacteria bacterium]|nr:MAG: nitrogen fixation protein FixH [Alphaproteobacteria bacterium]
MSIQSASGRERRLTGWHVLAILVVGFAVIIAVNLVMAWQAISTFPGLEVPNSYVASQNFDRERLAQERLGWTTRAEVVDGRLVIRIRDREGRPAQVRDLSVLVGHPTMARADQRPQMRREGDAFVAPITLGAGRWILHLEAHAEDGTRYHIRSDLHVKAGAAG